MRLTSLASMVVTVAICCYVVRSSDVRTAVMTNKVEFKTEAPRDVVSNTKKDCYEYLLGQLIKIRHHGTTWQNGNSDCSNCICDNGDIRCFFHFCKGPSTGYMTPPSRGSFDNARETDIEESSGYPPSSIDADYDGAYDDEDDDTRAIASNKEELNHNYLLNVIAPEAPVEVNDIIIDDDRSVKEMKGGDWPPKVIPEKWQTEVLSDSSDDDGAGAPLTLARVFQSKDKEKRNRSENETHDVFKQNFCGKTCKTICHRGYKVDPMSGCLKCKCKKCHVTCGNKCPTGYVIDDYGCNSCVCSTFSFTTDEDITFKEDPQDDLPLAHQYTTTAAPEEKRNEMLDKSSITFLEDSILEPVLNIPHSQNDSPAVPKDETTTFTSVGLIRDMFQTTKEQEKEPCNTTVDDAADVVVVPDLTIVVNTPKPNPVVEVYHKTRSEETIVLSEPFFDLEHDDEATVKSIAKDDHSTLLAILLPMGIFSVLVSFLFVHVWKRYRSDKYDINAYRPEEKQKLRPVKTLHDDQCSLKHV